MTSKTHNQPSSQDNSEDMSTTVDNQQETGDPTTIDGSSEGKKNKPLLNHINNHPALKLVKDCKLINDLHGVLWNNPQKCSF